MIKILKHFSSCSIFHKDGQQYLSRALECISHRLTSIFLLQHWPTGVECHQLAFCLIASLSVKSDGRSSEASGPITKDFLLSDRIFWNPQYFTKPVPSSSDSWHQTPGHWQLVNHWDQWQEWSTIYQWSTINQYHYFSILQMFYLYASYKYISYIPVNMFELDCNAPASVNVECI